MSRIAPTFGLGAATPVARRRRPGLSTALARHTAALIAFISVPVLAAAGERREAGPVAYLVTDSSGEYYARCSPEEGGTTRIYQVRSSGDRPLDTYPWCAPRTPRRLFVVAVGFDPDESKPLVAVVRPRAEPAPPDAAGSTPELTLYLAGKEVRAYTTADLTAAGAELAAPPDGSRLPAGPHARWELAGYDGGQRTEEGGKSRYGHIVLDLGGGRTIRLDIATGAIHAP